MGTRKELIRTMHMIVCVIAKRLKTLRGLTPYEYIRRCWQKEPERFRLNPRHHTVGLNAWELRQLDRTSSERSTACY